jgi:hypothetical protein
MVSVHNLSSGSRIKRRQPWTSNNISRIGPFFKEQKIQNTRIGHQCFLVRRQKLDTVERKASETGITMKNQF